MTASRRSPRSLAPGPGTALPDELAPGSERADRLGLDLLGKAHRGITEAASRLWVQSGDSLTCTNDAGAKTTLFAAVLELAQRLLGDDPEATQDAIDLQRGDVETAVRRNSLTGRAALDICRLAADPSGIEWPGCFGYLLYHPGDFDALTTSGDGAGLAPALRAILLAAGLMKFMGRFGASARIYQLLADAPSPLCKALGSIGFGDLHHVAALWARHLRADEAAGVSATAAYGLETLLRSTLRWSGLSKASFDVALAHYEQATRIAPGLPFAQYGLALCCQAVGRTDEAIERFQATRRLLAPDTPLWHSLATRIARLSASGKAGRLPEDRNWLRLQEIEGGGRDSARMARSYCNIVPSETIAYRYELYDATASRTVERERATRELAAFPAAGIRILGPGSAPVALENRHLLAESLLFSGWEREIWNPREVSAEDGSAVYLDCEGPSIEEDVIVLPGLGSFYFHFLFDVMGALSLVPSHEWRGRKFLFSQAPLQKTDLFGWQKEVLSMLGISPGDVIVSPDHAGDVRVNRGIVCSYPGQNNAVAPWVVRFLRSRLLTGLHRVRAGKRVLFTRTTTRLMQGDRASQLAEIARKHGFRIHDPMQMTVRQQRDVLADCDVFMAEAGSALANILFLPAGARVVMLATKLGFKDYFGPIAASLGLEMHVVLSDITAIYPRHQFLWSSFNPDLDLAALERCMAAVIPASDRPGRAGSRIEAVS